MEERNLIATSAMARDHRMKRVIQRSSNSLGFEEDDYLRIIFICIPWVSVINIKILNFVTAILFAGKNSLNYIQASNLVS